MFGLIMTLTAKVAKPLPKADKINTSFVMRECDNADVIRHRKLKEMFHFYDEHKRKHLFYLPLTKTIWSYTKQLKINS